MEKMIQLPLWHFKTIENALRLTNNVCDCHTKETAFDREVTKAYEYAKSALANADTGEGQSNIPDVSNCKPTGYDKNNLPIEIRHAYCEAVEIYQHICNYEYGIITKEEFIKEVEATKRKH